MTPATKALAELRTAWEAVVRPSARRASVAFAVAALFGAAHVARAGTPVARGIAVGLLVFAVVVVVARVVAAGRVRTDPRRMVKRTIGAVDPTLGAATLRAITLAEKAGDDPHGGSPELAVLHLKRLVGRVSRPQLLAEAGRVATRWAVVGLAFAVAALAASAVEPFRVVEGADVLLAQNGEAPLPLLWLDGVDMHTAPPEYLHEPGGSALAFAPVAVPRGTVLTLRGRPTRAGRALLLGDGKTDVPFVEDGTGSVVARWTVSASTTLAVSARFGRVRVTQADQQEVISIPDEAPKVVVDGAPRTVKLIDEPAVSLHYEATDDHGLREIDLVLRSQGKEERRVLSRPSADAKADRGGYELRASDPFFKKNYAPTEVTVEARDNDVVSGPKWGKSEIILVVPPDVGEPEARRLAALITARDALVDLLADRMKQDDPKAGAAAAHVAHEALVQGAALDAVDKVFSEPHGGLAIKGRARTMARGQARRLRKALEAEKKTPSAATHKKLLEETESALLAFDGAIRALGYRDARAVGKRLGAVAEDAATTLATSEEGDRGPTKTHLDASIGVLDAGGKQLAHLGDLGRDLGELVGADLRRVARPRGVADAFHTELALRDLAARLRRPDPSFAGGGGKGTGVESGANPNSGAGSEGDEDADEQMAGGEHELDQIASEQEGASQETQASLDGAGTPEEREQAKEEAKEHAQAVRDALKGLPNNSPDATSAEAQAAAGREAAEGMASALERGDVEAAAQNGKRASQALQEAKRIGDRARNFPPEMRAGQKAARARETIDRELAWTEDMLEKLRRGASGRVKGDLAKQSDREKKIADRTRDLAAQGEGGDESMPEQMLEQLQEAERKMREAEKALKDGDGQRGLERQREAQKLLEMAKQQRGEDKQDGPAEQTENGKTPQGKAAIPDKDKHKGPEAFRKRVLEGLGSSSDASLREAVKRYAEGLLK